MSEEFTYNQVRTEMLNESGLSTLSSSSCIIRDRVDDLLTKSRRSLSKFNTKYNLKNESKEKERKSKHENGIKKVLIN